MALQTPERANELVGVFPGAVRSLTLRRSMRRSSYDAAASCYLKALDLNPQANHIWTYLGMTLTSMGRPDLVEQAALQDPNAFRGDFDF